MDGIFAAGQGHRRDAHRVARRTAGNNVGHVRLVVLDFLRRRPGRIAVFAVDPGGTRPLLAGFADPDRVAHGMTLVENEIEVALVGPYHDRSRRIVAVHADHFRPGLGRIRHQQSRPDGGGQRHRNPHRHQFLRLLSTKPARSRLAQVFSRLFFPSIFNRVR